jgi:glucosamine 6-phosphate synthetase-like amidotransferase/phosphosugar isomerase protein
MCGIMGYYSFGNTMPDKEKITDMFSLLETRGRDASGFAFIKNGNLFVYKAPIKTTDMIKTDEWKNLALPKSMILHARLKTEGSEKNNANNHPIYSKAGLALVHNGIVYNHKEIFGKKERDAEVDSEAILSILSLKGKGDKIKRLFERAEGSFAVAAINKAEPDKLTLIKKDNPIELYFDSENDILYFCSERDIMKETLGINTIKKRGFSLGEVNYHFYDMENNHALIINKEGVESYQKYFPKSYSWFDRRFDYSADKVLVQCPWCLCQTKYYYSKLFNKCEECGVSINEEDVYDVL